MDFYCDLVERGLGIPVTDRRPQLAVSDADRTAAKGALGATAMSGEGYALLVPGGNNPAKRWPPDRFARIAEHLANRHGLSIVAAGSPGECEVIDAIVRGCSVPVMNLAAEPTGKPLGLGGLKAVVAGARAIVTNDTGPRHFAAAFAVPTVALFGPTDHRWTVLRDVPERLVIAEPFLPEELLADDRPTLCRIDRISVGDVAEALDALLARAPNGSPAPAQ